jgi:hypothetical protein
MTLSKSGPTHEILYRNRRRRGFRAGCKHGRYPGIHKRRSCKICLHLAAQALPVSPKALQSGWAARVISRCFAISDLVRRPIIFKSHYYIYLLMAASKSQTPPEVEEPGRREVIFGPAPPSLSIDMAINPSIYSVSSADLPNLSFSITSHSTHPITILTNGTVLTQERPFIRGKDYTATDINTNQRVWFSTEYVQRGCSIEQRLGHSDERHFLTLLPEVPVKISYPFGPAGGWKRRDPSKGLTVSPRAPHFKGEEFRTYFEPGHKYRFGIAYKQGRDELLGPVQGVLWWRYGTKEEVLAPRGAPSARTALGWSERHIVFRNIPDVELTIEE